VVWRFLKKLKIDYHLIKKYHFWLWFISKGNKNGMLRRYLHSHVCCIIYNSQLCKQSKWLSEAEWVKRIYYYIHTDLRTYIHTVEYFSVLQKVGLGAISNKMDEPGRHYSRWNNAGPERQIPHILTCVQYLKSYSYETRSRKVVTKGWRMRKIGDILAKSLQF
jgi:hypothetical protein